MKKLLVGVLVFGIILNGVSLSLPAIVQAYNENDYSLQEDTVLNSDLNSNQTSESSEDNTDDLSIEEIADPAQEVIDVNDYDGLKTAVAKSNVTINIQGNIQFTDVLNVTGSNIIINGGNHNLDLNPNQGNTTNRFVIKGNDIEIHDLTVDNYSSTGIYLYRAQNITLTDITLNGVAQQSTVGIDLDASTANIANITSKNHRYSGIRLRNTSGVQFLGENVHINDTRDLESVNIHGQPENSIIDEYYLYLLTGENVSSDKTSLYYTVKTIVDVGNFEELQAAILTPNSIINITNNIVFTGDIEIKQPHITISGNKHTISLGGTHKFSVKSNHIALYDFTIQDYAPTGLTLYNASDINLSNLTLMGNDITLPTEQRSTVGIDIFQSTVMLGDIKSHNHLYRGIQLRNGSTVTISDKNFHSNDTVHMQSIIGNGDADVTINDPKKFYLLGVGREVDGITTANHFSRVDVDIFTAEQLIANLKNSGNVLHILDDITFENTHLPADATLLELDFSSNIIIEGYNHKVNLNNLATITLKGDSTQINNLTISNANTMGLNIYNSVGIVLDNVIVENSSRYGIFVNGSEVKLKNCFTRYNLEGGVMITRSRTLNNKDNRDSYVEVIESMQQRESNIGVSVQNVEMLDKHYQNNQFVVPENIFVRYENDVEYKVLSDYYLEIFGITGDDRFKKYKEQIIDYMIIQTRIDAKTNTEVLNDDGSFVQLVGDGVTDDTDNLEKLIKYAATHSKEIYFPAGVYKITRDINISDTNLIALSNFTLTGDTNGLSILDASSVNDKMVKLSNTDYHFSMNYINVNNLVFNNIGLEFNGPYKKGISLNNNVFMNGKYISTKNAAGELTLVTMDSYITIKNSKYTVEQNIFLRGNNYPGRGIATYRTKNTRITDNFFGKLEGISDAERMLPETVIDRLRMIEQQSSTYTNDNIKAIGSQGNFFTAINNERYDTNVMITNNYFDLDKTKEIL